MFLTRSVLVTMVALCGLLVVASPSVVADDGEATGLITVGGKPLASGKITFHRDNGQFVGCKVKDGKYTIDRVPAGTLRVTIEGKGVPPAYTSEDTSALVVEVKKGAATFDFNLK
jgi:hypothetical protein